MRPGRMACGSRHAACDVQEARCMRYSTPSSSDARRTPYAARPSSGFTLIEVLAALIIVALGMMAVIQAVGQTASNSAYLREKTLAHWVALNRLTEVRLDENPPKVDKTSDEVEMAGRTWRWTMVVTQTPVETMRRIDINVRPEEADEDASIASITGFYGAAIAPPGSALILWEGLDPAIGQNGNGDDDEDDEDEPPKDDPPTEDEPPVADPPTDDESQAQ